MALGGAEPPIRVGFVGLGDIGEPMARHIIQAGFPVRLWARREASLSPFRSESVTLAANLAELGRESDVVGVCVFSDEDVREVVLGGEGILDGIAPGGIILIHSTVLADTVIELAERCAAKGVTVMDVPVSGFRSGAEAGQLTVMAGGPPEAFDFVRPVLESFGSHVVHLGPTGSGLRMKALNQALLFANLNSAALALDAGRELGLDPGATQEVLSSATGSSSALRMLTTRILTDPEFVDHGGRVVRKDLAIFQNTCADAGIVAPELTRIADQAMDSVYTLISEK